MYVYWGQVLMFLIGSFWFLDVCMYGWMDACLYVCMYVGMPACLYVWLYVGMYVCIYFVYNVGAKV